MHGHPGPEPHEDTNRTINGFAISALIDLRAVEAIGTIRNAFRRNAVDLTIAGDAEDVEIELGLRDRRATSKPHHAILPAERSPWPGADRIQPAMHVLPKHEK
jgi:hypothetical protein